MRLEANDFYRNFGFDDTKTITRLQNKTLLKFTIQTVFN